MGSRFITLRVRRVTAAGGNMTSKEEKNTFNSEFLLSYQLGNTEKCTHQNTKTNAGELLKSFRPHNQDNLMSFRAWKKSVRLALFD